MQRDGLTTQASNSIRYGYANPEYNGGDVGHGGVDDHVMRTIRLAAASVKTGTAGGRRVVLVIPLFSRGNEEYRKAVSQMGGRILLEWLPTRLNGIHPRQSLERRRQSENG